MTTLPRPSETTVEVKVDGRAIEVPKSSTALQALRRAGLDVPTLCHDPRLKPIGACRACLVKVKGFSKPLTSCSLPIEEGMEIEVDTPELREARRSVLEMLARDYPAHFVQDFPEKPFHRHLRDAGLTPVLQEARDASGVDDSNPYFRFDPSACIECYRCVRICDEVQGAHVWEILDRGPGTRVRPVSLESSNGSACKSCGACSDTCPTGAIVDKSRESEGLAEAWTKTTCPYCGVGCELWAGTRDGRIVQCLPVIESPVNKGHLCIKGRYAHGYVHAPDRLSKPLIRREGKLIEASWDEAISVVA